jgi:hypothetical protein
MLFRHSESSYAVMEYCSNTCTLVQFIPRITYFLPQDIDRESEFEGRDVSMIECQTLGPSTFHQPFLNRQKVAEIRYPWHHLPSSPQTIWCLAQGRPMAFLFFLISELNTCSFRSTILSETPTSHHTRRVVARHYHKMKLSVAIISILITFSHSLALPATGPDSSPDTSGKFKPCGCPSVCPKAEPAVCGPTEHKCKIAGECAFFVICDNVAIACGGALDLDVCVDRPVDCKVLRK